MNKNRSLFAFSIGKNSMFCFSYGLYFELEQILNISSEKVAMEVTSKENTLNNSLQI